MDGEEPEKGLNATLVFMKWGEINGNVGCSDYLILHEFEGDRFRITKEDIGSGTLRCGKPQAVKEQEAEFEGVLRSPSSLRTLIAQAVCRTKRASIFCQACASWLGHDQRGFTPRLPRKMYL